MLKYWPWFTTPILGVLLLILVFTREGDESGSDQVVPTQTPVVWTIGTWETALNVSGLLELHFTYLSISYKLKLC